MICFQVTVLPSIGDYVNYHGRKHQVITNPKASGMNCLFMATVRHVADSFYCDRDIYFELIK